MERHSGRHKGIEDVELARRNTTMHLGAVRGHLKSFKGTAHGVEFKGTWRETVERNLSTRNTNNQGGWCGTDKQRCDEL